MATEGQLDFQDMALKYDSYYPILRIGYGELVKSEFLVRLWIVQPMCSTLVSTTSKLFFAIPIETKGEQAP